MCKISDIACGPPFWTVLVSWYPHHVIGHERIQHFKFPIEYKLITLSPKGYTFKMFDTSSGTTVLWLRSGSTCLIKI